MNMVLECDVTLSKKLEAICENGEPISIHVTSVSGNKGRAVVRMSCKNGTSEQDITKIGETSIMLRINSATDDVKSLGEARRVGNFVGLLSPQMQTKIACTSPDIPEGQEYIPPQKKSQSDIAELPSPEGEINVKTLNLVIQALKAAGLNVPSGLLNSKNQETSSIAKTDQKPSPPRDNCIMTYDELMNEINSLPNIEKDPNIPTNKKLTPREAEIITSKMPRLRKKAYLRNKLQSQFLISDLFTTIDGGGTCLALLPGAAFDLSRIPARNILNSTELKWCFESDKVELVNAETYAASFKKVEASFNAWDQAGGLQVYGGDVSRLNPQDSSGGAAESLASGMASDDQESGNIISVDSAQETMPPSAVYDGNPLIQQIIGGLPKDRQNNHPQRI